MAGSALTLGNIVLLCGFSLLLAAGQFMFKFTAQSSPSLSSLQGLMSLALSPWLWIALTLYGTATILWIFILQRVPLSLAYPFSALGFIIVPLGAWLVFHEPLTLRYGLGVACILGGVFILSR